MTSPNYGQTIDLMEEDTPALHHLNFSSQILMHLRRQLAPCEDK